MADKTGIEWTDATWNPIRGCSRVSEGCRNCYAETVANRFCGPGSPYEGVVQIGADGKGNGKWNGQIKFVEKQLLQPLKWKHPRKIFVNSMSDLLHPGVTEEMLINIAEVMLLAYWHTFQVLTKRPENYHRLTAAFEVAKLRAMRFEALGGIASRAYVAALDMRRRDKVRWELPLPNVWLGVSVEDQKAADVRIPLLLQTPAAVRFISAEPLLGAIDLDPWMEVIEHCGQCGEESAASKEDLCPECGAENMLITTWGWDEAERYRSGERYDPDSAAGRDDLDGKTPNLDWVICGGESGPGARPMHPDWARGLRDQCVAAGVPFFFKQWGEWAPSIARPVRGEHTGGGLFLRPNGIKGCQGDWWDGNAAAVDRVGKKAAGNLLDGVVWQQMPEVAK